MARKPVKHAVKRAVKAKKHAAVDHSAEGMWAGSADEELEDEPEAAEAEAPEIDAAPWYPSSEPPADGKIVELETCGDVERGHHSGGRWLLEGKQQSVHVDRWRPIGKK